MLKKDSPIFLQNINMIARQLFLLFKKSTTFWDNPRTLYNFKKTTTRFDVYETLCPQQVIVHKGGQIKNWDGECRDITPAVSKYSKSTAGILQ